MVDERVEVLLRELREGGVALPAGVEEKLRRWAGEARAAEVGREAGERRLKLALEAGRMGTWDWEVGTERVEWSEGHYTLLGYRPGEVESTHENFRRRVHPEDRPRQEGAIREALEGRTEYACEFRVVWPDGSVHWLEARGRFAFDESGAAVRMYGVLIDIEGRKRAEAALRASEAEAQARADELAAVMEAVPAITFIAHDPRCERMTCNRAARRLLRLGDEANPSQSAPAGERPRYRVLRDGREARPEELPMQVAAATGREVADAEWTFLFEDGTTRQIVGGAMPLFGADGAVRGAVGAFVDITERKRVEEVLRESEGRFRQMADALPQMVWVTRPDGHHEYYNRRWYEYTGVPEGSTDGAGWNGMFHAADQDRAWARWRQSLATGEPYEIEYRLRRHDGEYRWVLGRAMPVRDGRGEIERWFGTCTDIHDQKVTEAELARRESELKRLHGMAEEANRAKDQFLATLSHELRTPLTPVLTAVHELAGTAGLPADAREAVEMIRRNVELEARLIDDLLDLTRIERGKVELHRSAVDLHEKVRQVAEICEAEVRGKGLELALELRASRRWVEADGARVQQVLWNLLKNAAKFTPEGGRIVVRTFDGEAGGVGVEVVDTGRGISAEVLPRLFNSFEQGSREVTRMFGGLGLGLWISRAVMDLHGGTLTAASEGAGRGATFTVWFPASVVVGRPAEAHRPAAREARSGGRAAGCRVLLVEDHPDTAKIMARMLTAQGYWVRTAEGVAAAVRAAEGEAFDVVVSDIGLPDGSGLDLMRLLVAKHRLKGIALSGYGMEEDVRKSREAGFVEHLTKPVDVGRLTAVVERVVGGGGREQRVESRE